MQIFSRIFGGTLWYWYWYVIWEVKNAILFLACKIFFPKIRSCKIVEKFHVCKGSFFLCQTVFPPLSSFTIIFYSSMEHVDHLFSLSSCICDPPPMDPQDLKYNMIGHTVILLGFLCIWFFNRHRHRRS